MLGFSPIGSVALGDDGAQEAGLISLEGVLCGIPEVSSATFAQTNNLTGVDFNTALPTVGTPVFTSEQKLTLLALVTETPEVIASALVQKHTLSLLNFACGTPTLGQSSLGSIVLLLGASIVTGVPTSTSPYLGVPTPLSATSIVTESPVNSATTVAQKHLVSLSKITSLQPSLTGVEINQEHTLVGQELLTGAVSLSSSSVGYNVNFSSSAIVAQSPTVQLGNLTIKSYNPSAFSLKRLNRVPADRSRSVLAGSIPRRVVSVPLKSQYERSVNES